MEAVKRSSSAADMLFDVANPNESTKQHVRTNRGVQEACRLQDQHIEINYISIH